MKKFFTVMASALIALTSCAGGEGNGNCATQSCEANRDSMVLVLNFTRKIKPGHAETFKQSFLKCKVNTMLEPGCLGYDIYESPNDSTLFFIYEAWKTESDLKKHGETEHLKIHIKEIAGTGDESYKGGTYHKIFVCPEANK